MALHPVSVLAQATVAKLLGLSQVQRRSSLSFTYIFHISPAGVFFVCLFVCFYLVITFIRSYISPSPQEELGQRMLARTMRAGVNETIVIALSDQDATYARDALAKYIYGQLFLWLVRRINAAVPGAKAAQG